MKFSALVCTAILFISQLGCSSDPASSDQTTGQVKFSIRGMTNSGQTQLNKTVTSVTLTSVQVVIKEIEFESIFEDSVDFEFEEPFVQDLVVGVNVHEVGSVKIPFGTYEEMEIEIDDLDEEDGPAFTQNPELQDVSIRVEGFLDDDTTNTFVFTSRLDEEQEEEFNPPLVIDATSPSANVVLTVDMRRWFVDENTPLDPRLESNRSTIENNIKNSLKVFEDEDDDGKEDDEDDNDDDGGYY